MASGALPPGFPPVEIDGEPYWDGGLVSNTPLAIRARRTGSAKTCSSSRSTCSAPKAACRKPCSISGSGKRRSAIRAAPGSTPTFSASCRPSAGPSAACGGRYRTSSCDNPDWRLLDGVSCNAAVTILLLIHRRAAYWTQSNDYEFSRYSMDEHWLAGVEDVEHSFNHPDWKSRTRPEEGVRCSISPAISTPIPRSERYDHR